MKNNKVLKITNIILLSLGLLYFLFMCFPYQSTYLDGLGLLEGSGYMFSSVSVTSDPLYNLVNVSNVLICFFMVFALLLATVQLFANIKDERQNLIINIVIAVLLGLAFVFEICLIAGLVTDQNRSGDSCGWGFYVNIAIVVLMTFGYLISFLVTKLCSMTDYDGKKGAKSLRKQLENLTKMKEDGIINEEEFEELRKSYIANAKAGNAETK